MTSDDCEREEWEQLIGKAILSFAEIELITYHFLKHIPQDDIFQAVSRLSFGHRVDLILRILNGRNGLPDVGEKFKENLQKARKLTEVRNLIAHNPTMLDVYEHRESGAIGVERTIRAVRNQQRFLDLAGLKEYAAEVEDLVGDLWMNIGKLIEWHEAQLLPERQKCT